MKIRGHSKILAWVSVIWLLFWLAGLPDYYQQYSTSTMLLFDSALLFPLAGFIYWLLNRTAREYRRSLAFWLAFYISIPLFIYDAIYCGIYLGFGVEFLLKYWYLSIYYIIPWILYLLVVIALNHQRFDSK